LRERNNFAFFGDQVSTIEFQTTLNYELHGEFVEAEISYIATPCQENGLWFTRHGYEIEVVEAKYTQFGLEILAEGKIWQKLERLAQEAAESHWFGPGRAA
jgi:hypothetical protein